MPKRWAPKTALRNRAQLVGLVAGSDLPADSLLQKGMLDRPAELSPGEREVAILVDAETGVAGKIGPGSRGRHRSPPSRRDPDRGIKPKSTVVVPAARIIDVGQAAAQGRPRRPAGRGRPEAGRAGHLRAHAEAAARGHRGGVLRRRGPARAAAARRPRAARRRASAPTRGPTRDDPAPRCSSRSPTPSSRRARRRSPRRARGSRWSTASPTPRSCRARCAGSTSTSCCSTTPSAACRCSTSRATSPRASRRSGSILIAADDSPDLLRAADAGRPARRRLAPALARAARGQRARRLAVVADDARPRRRGGVGRRARSAAS